MTGKQLEAAEEAQRIAGASWEDGEELRCIGMIHSILIYNYHPKQERFLFPIDNEYLQNYIKHLGVERVSELWMQEVADYRHAEVGFAGCDADGVAYNYCKWADD